MRFLGLMIGLGFGLISLGWGQTAIVRVGQDNTYTSGYQNFNAGTLGLPRGNTDPATCSVGDRFVNTTTTPAVSKVCTTSNTWVLDILSNGALTSGRVSFATTGGLLMDSAGLTFSDASNVRTLTVIRGSSQSNTDIINIQWGASSGDRWHLSGAGSLFGETNSAGIKMWLAPNAPSVALASDVPLLFNSGTNLGSGSQDTSLSRISAGVIGVGTGTAGSVTGSERAASFQASGGTKFTISGCSAGTTIGGASAGSFVSGTTGSCVVDITINGATGLTAPNGWACSANNLTTPANLISQSAVSATTVQFTGTTVTNDVIVFHCLGY